MRKTRIAVLGTIGAVAASLALSASSSAAFNSINIRVDEDRPIFHGVIQSLAERCERDRYLYIKKVRPGPNKFVGDDLTSFRGGWSVDVNPQGTYAIRINRDNNTGCGGDKEVVFSFGQ